MHLNEIFQNKLIRILDHPTPLWVRSYEYGYYIRLYEEGSKDKSSKMEHIFRYQDALLALNDYGLLENVLSDIYPDEMFSDKTNIDVSVIS